MYNFWCLDGKEVDNGGVTMQPCNTGEDMQELWDLDSTNDEIINLYNGWCLDGKEANNGGVTMQPCNTGEDMQELWFF
jgi:hypothetical protein